MGYHASFLLIDVNQEQLVLVDQNKGKSVTNDAEHVIRTVNDFCIGGLGRRRVYYRDTDGQWDELCHMDGEFTWFAACTPEQRARLEERYGSLAPHPAELDREHIKSPLGEPKLPGS